MSDSQKSRPGREKASKVPPPKPSAGRHETNPHHTQSLGGVVKTPSPGPGQTWLKLTKHEVEEYRKAHSHDAETTARQPVLRRVVGTLQRIFKGLGKSR
jgi:hypothetical protein